MALKPVTVSQLNEYIGRLLSTDPLLRNVVVKGEITSIKYHSTGHVYFNLSDHASKLSCFMANTVAASLGTILEEGDEVILTGTVRVFQKGGYYSLNVRSAEPVGAGVLAEQFARMKAKLEKEGLFDPAHKKPLPTHPKHIGVVTSRDGAAVKDILKTLDARHAMADVTIFPAAVQGTGAAEDIAAKIDLVDRLFSGDVDLLIVGRGGGSPEELSAFNQEVVARAIYRCSIPVISAVGHEIDFSISDLVADARAATPTAAGLMAAPDRDSLMRELEKRRDDMTLVISNKVMYEELTAGRLRDLLQRGIETRLSEQEAELERLALILKGNDPRKILGNGYAIVTDRDGRTVTSAGALGPGDEAGIRFSDGLVRVKVTESEAQHE